VTRAASHPKKETNSVTRAQGHIEVQSAMASDALQNDVRRPFLGA
jgi:hypothetical protein